MQVTVGVVDFQAFAEGIQTIAFAWIVVTRHFQGISDFVAEGGDRGFAQQFQLGIEKAHVEGGVMDDQFRTGNEIQKRVGDIGKTRFVGQELG